ncbi:NupC/NupG family nucleoside CNT transporter [Testudinibacter sp. TR-2022]|uniref:NupC/NupG family nucleoside CNT transporter n=1 Tax=Testudinibacter sp. TR-2022 TaxID=2585029 RepID=UPI001119F940|nr:NupC/NupG family nucleoside CNT transporter [Testudinibacter sp. TR-2022]TNH02978.1 NupC/NupG family nucleoside CNT transporter [Pasteurellaceae bacterium Phil31]TNH10398.1 NupC/NupG family nucleoside CNT transporter [Testudinibacter sp. TR-2022]TNH12378.1 NupC/NupG family nucleoside CNT transporter [Testudinibacter sp. TR-2022]TNH14042.1 NupC/NupG family nucleoside CNT transporter [Testudinibacter sp. TR-2022]TNH15442.1 NupC/NupG family nucleoside CNT transporter [Testudinibacter sp. TR-20
MDSLMSILGIIVLLGIAFLLSNNRKAINLRTVLGALAIQVSIGALILYVPAGRDALLAAAEGVQKVINYGNDGIGFLFGGLVSDKMFEVFGGGGFVFALRVLPAIIFFASLISVLYYIGVMQWVIKIIGGFLQLVLKTSKTESMSAAANIFVGQTEAPLIVKPYIAKMTESELFAIMCGGLASVAGAVMIGYAQMGVPLPYLIAASFMAAPGGLLFAKILIPQTEHPHDDLDHDAVEEKPSNVLDAAAAGASSGMQLALNVGAMLLAFIALIALLNGIIGGIGSWFNYPELSLQIILGWVFQPLAYVIGVPWNEAQVAGSMIGQKLVINEFVAYMDFVKYLGAEAPMVLTEKTKAIITFALCGFANFSSIAILIGGLGTMAPNRRSDVARLGIKAVIAGSLSNLMSAAIAGLFIGLTGAALVG